MSRPTIGVYISTTGDARLINTLHSIASQNLIEGDRVVIASDGPWTQSWHPRNLSKSRLGPDLRAHVTFVEREKRPSSEWGHWQNNESIELLKGTVDLITAQDQDDIFTPRAFDAMRSRAEQHPNHLIMSRVYNHAWGLLWRTPGWDTLLKEGDESNMALDGHCPWMPGREPLLPHFGLPYNGDQEYVQANRLLFWNRVVWAEEITTITRPEQSLRWKMFTQQVNNARLVEWLRVLYNDCAEYMTGEGAQITPDAQKKFWKEIDHSKNWFWIFYLPVGNVAREVGFLRMELRDDGAMWVTYGLTSKFRGMGLGREMVQFSLLAAQGFEVRGLVREDNARAIALYRKSGFTLTPHDTGVLGMRLAYPPPFLQKG